MITHAEAKRRLERLRDDLQDAELALVQLGLREVARRVYEARLDLSDAGRELDTVVRTSGATKEGP